MNTQEDKLKRALLAIKKLKQQIEETNSQEPVAVVGIGCRFPGGVTDTDSFWQLLEQGRDGVGEVPKERWDIDRWYDSDPDAAGKMYTKWGGFLPGIETFDPEFFGISPREAPSIDPQQRLLLEVAWEAFENAGMTQASLRNSDTGVYVGICGNDYQMKALSDAGKIDAYTILGTAHSAIGGRLSYTFGLKGPNIAVDTACSSSLVAVHMAVQALRNNECSQAVAGGVGIVLSPKGSVYFSKLKALSPTGRCHTFSSKADGFVRSEGCGMIVLKRLSDARKDGDKIWGVIRGSAINQDGNSQGFTAPNGPSQQDVIKRALSQAGVEPHEIDYIEAHGTGTLLGDPIEVGALTAVLGAERKAGEPLYIGSVKTNIGHTEGAAGIAGIIKTLLAFEHQCIPKNIHFDTPSAHIPWDEIPVKVVGEPLPWQCNDKRSRLAGVSSFGFSGTNAHVILEEAPSVEQRNDDQSVTDTAQLITVSAKKHEALKAATDRLLQHVKNNPQINLADLAFSLATAKTHFSKRRAFVVADTEQLIALLEAGLPEAGNFMHDGKTAFLFTGQGSQYTGMGRELYAFEPVFKHALDTCARLLKPLLEKDLLDVMFDEAHKDLLAQTLYAQPALFSLEYALFQLWTSFGLQPDILLGHSVGEIVAACVAGVFSLEDAITLIAARGRLMQALPEGGAMAGVSASNEKLVDALRDYEQLVTIAAENAPGQQVISGDGNAVKEICARLHAEGVQVKMLDVSHAFHSMLMEPMLEAFGEAISNIHFSAPQLPIVSNVTGELCTAEIATPAYWVNHIRMAVQFAGGVKTLESYGVTLAVEAGPHPVLTSLAQMNIGEQANIQWIYSLRKNEKDTAGFLQNIAAWYEAGGNVDWAQVYRNRSRKRIALPAYPFQRKKYWLEEDETMVPEATNVVANDQRAVKTGPGAAVNTAGVRVELPAVMQQLRHLIVTVLKMSEEEVSDTTPLLEIGADSLIVMELLKKIEREFRVKIAIRRIFEDLTTIKLLAQYIVEQQPAPGDALQSDIRNMPVMSVDGATDLNGRYLQLLEQQQQVTNELLAVLKGNTNGYKTSINPVPVKPVPAVVVKDKPAASVLPSFGVKEKTGNTSENPYLQTFIKTYCERTAQSKAFTDASRSLLADNRASAGFRFSTKEMLYPIVGKSSKGVRFRDIDNNEYIDLTMGFGSNIFGHQPSFITEAIQSQLDDGIHIGPQSYLVKEVSSLFTSITGLDRVCFVNTGTEAVMTAVRIARKVTGRSKLVIFNGSYHGHFDGVLGAFDEDTQQVEPVAGGILPGMVRDLLVLDYCDDQSLEIIRNNAHDIAAVIVEPVQSRHLEIKPEDFLKRLRTLTSNLDVPLIFDEMITGFRILPGGAQAYFGIKADIATYGKVAGGGMPIGAIAGDRKYMDAIDGGAWQYGDKSFPEVDTTFLAGTFSKHPLTMAAALATLRRIKEVGEDAYAQLNKKTEQFVEKLNAFFREEAVAIEVLNFGSLFRFTFQTNMDLLFYHLIRYGVYVWEGRNCFLSFAHTEQDLEEVIAAVKQSIRDLKENGFLPTNDGNRMLRTDANDEGKLPLNTAQKQLWVLDKMNSEGGQAYIIHTNIELKGALNKNFLREAVSEVVAHNQALQCCFDEDGMYHRFTDAPLQMEDVDLTAQAGDEQAKILKALLEQRSVQPFVLESGRLIRFQLIRLNDRHHVLAFQAHHIICDGQSTVVIIEQIAQLYNAKSTGGQASLEKCLSYTDAMHLQRRVLASEEMQEHAAFWVEQFKGNRQALNFPFDHAHSDERRYAGASVTIELDKDVMDGLKKIAQTQFCTPFMILFSAYATWLHRLCNQEELVLGFPTNGRSFSEEGLDWVVGFYSHLLPVISRQRGDESFISYLKRTTGHLLSVFEHEAFPYAELLQRIGAKHFENDLITTVFNVDKIQDAPVMNGLEISWLPQEASYTNMDFKMNLTDLGDRFVLECIYSSALFDAGTMEGYVGNFIQLLKSIVSNPEANIADLMLMTGAEQNKLLHDFNNTTADFPSGSSLVDLFELQVNKHPQVTALVFEGKTFSYQALNDMSNQLAAYLREVHAVQPEQVVAIKLERSEWLMISVLAVLKAGAAFLPLEPDFPAERISFMLQDSDAATVIDQNEINRFVSTQQYYSVKNNVAKIAPQQLAYIIYTSGSTGKPKGVAIAHRNMVNYIYWFLSACRSSDLGSSVLLSSYTFDGVYTSVFGTLLNGGTLHVLPQRVVRDPELLLDYVVNEKITFLKITPSYLRLAIQSSRFEHAFANAEKLSLLVIGGEAIFASDLRSIAAIRPDIQLMNHYGPTEATVGMCAHLIATPDLERFIQTPVIGSPVYNTCVYIVDASMKPVPQGAIGEVCVSGAGLATGYINNPVLTAERFIDNPFEPGQKLYRTGDLGRWKADGTIQLIGRMDDQVKVRGYRIELGEIEETLRRHEAVENVAVTVFKQETGDNVLAAYVVSTAPLDVAELRNWLTGYLPTYMVPAYFVEIDEIPLGASGKVNRKLLPAPDKSSQPEAIVFTAPRNATEQVLADVWKIALKAGDVGTRSNFYELGGDSIKSIQVASLVKQRGYSLKIEDILRYPVLEDIAARMNTAVRAIDQSAVEGIVPMSPIQLRFFVNDGILQKHHYNQSVVLRAASRVDKEILSKCFADLTRHHDALRMVYRMEDGQWIQENKDITHKSYSVNFFDLRQKTNAQELFLQRCESLQSSIRLEEGPLVKLGLFRFDDADKLVIVIHHLVVDGVSWRILLEDFSALYLQHVKGMQPALPQKTDSFRQWTQSLSKVAAGKKLKAEGSYWQHVLDNQATVFFTDNEPGVNTDMFTRSVVLEKDITRLLQTGIHNAYSTDLNDVLLTGLAFAVKQVFGITRSNMLLEGHGREALGEEIDTSRTIGWFTAVFPFVLDVDHVNDLLAGLVQVKEDVRRIPNKGAGYGLLKYLGDGFETGFVPHIAFNYLGDFGFEETNTEDFFVPADEFHGRAEAQDNRAHAALLDVTAMILSGRLKLSIGYRGNYNDTTVQRLMDAWQLQLQTLGTTLSAINEVRLTPGDLSFKGLSLQEFEHINASGDVMDVYPLSPLQEGMYFHWLAEPESTMYSIQRAYRMTGNVDAQIIHRAFEWLVARHDMLRTRFGHTFAAGNLQVVYKQVVPDFTLIELPGDLSAAAKQAFLDNVKKTDRDRGFDLEQGLAVRLTVIDLHDEGYELVWSYHHILMDGWCANILISEFDQALESLQKREPVKAGAVVPYVNYINWLGNIDKEASLGYWENYLSGYAEVAMPPHMQEQRTGMPFAFRQEVLALTGERYRQLTALCHKLGVTESVFIQAAWGYLLSKYNNTQDVVFGNVVSGRPKDLEGVSDMVGLFINTIPVRISYDTKATPAQLLKKVQEEAIEGMAHHYINLSEVQNTNPLGQRLFNHIMEFENYLVRERGNQAPEQGFAKNDIESFEHTHYDLAIVVSHNDNQTHIHFNYNAAAFERADIAGMRDHLGNVIDVFTRAPQQMLCDASYLSREEYTRLIDDYNATTVAYPGGKTLADLFTEQAARTPGNIALIFADRQWTYEALLDQASRLSNYLQQKGVKGKPVPVVSCKSAEQVWAVLGVVMAGGHYVPINGEWPEARISAVVQQVSPEIILAQPAYLSKIADTVATVITLEDAALQESSVAYQPVICSEDELAYVIFTSGSTGKPKGVMIDHKAAVNTLYDMNARFNCTEKDRVFGISDLSFDLSVYDIFGTLACGAALVLPLETETQSPAAWLSYIEKAGVTVWNSVPQLANLLIEEQETQSRNILSGVRLYLMSGDWIPVDLPERIKNCSRRADVISLGGATEGAIWSVYYPVAEVLPEWKSIPYGYPLGNQEMYILDDALNPCPVGIAGGIFIGGKGVARGYYGDPEKTAHSFIDHPVLKKRLYRTGDLGYHHRDGYMNFLGRLDGQVKIRGYRIELGEIEAVLQMCPYLETAVVAARGLTGARDKELVAYLVSKEETDATQVRNFLQRHLPEYMIPQYFVSLQKLPLTANGKVDRNALPMPELAGMQQQIAQPVSDAERRLAVIWSDVLETPVESIGIYQDFFEAGGHSIRAIRLTSKINKAFGVNVQIKDIFRHVNIAAQARLIEQSMPQHGRTIGRVGNQADYVLSPAQRRLWVLCQFEETNIAYNIPAVYELKGALNHEALQAAFMRVITRHEILRTTFHVNGSGEVRQRISAPEATGFYVAQVNMHDMEDAEETWKAAVNVQKLIPFDLVAGPLLRATIYHMDAQRSILFFNMHHIISDGWSVGVLMKELFSCYNALLTQSDVQLEELPVQYKDYADWQLKQLSEDGQQVHRAYWMEHLAGELPVLNMPSDYMRPAVQTHNGAKAEWQLSAATTASLREWVAGRGGTLFMGLLATVEALLYRYTGQDDMIIGSPVAGRDREELGSQIGLYMNTLPLRLSIMRDSNFEQVFEQVKTVTLGAYDHQMYPFDDLIDNLDVKRDLSRSALFDVMVDLQYNDHPENSIALEGLTIGECRGNHITSKLDLSFDFKETSDNIQFTIEYNTDIYAAARIERMARHFENLLGACLCNPQAAVTTVNYLGDEERQQLLCLYNDTFTPRASVTVVDLFESQVAARADAIALRFEDTAMTYRSLDERSNQLAHYLIAQYGAAPGDRIAIMLQRSEWMIVAVLAVLKTGQAYVPVDMAYPADRIDYMQENSQCKTCIDAAMIDVFTKVAKQYPVNLPEVDVQPQHLAYMIYTSGSTGKPKGVMVAHHSLVNIALAWKESYRLETGSVSLLQMASISFDVFFGDLCRSLLTGGTMIICPDSVRLDWKGLYELMAKYKVNIFEATPGLVLPFMDYVYRRGKDISFLTTLIVGSDSFDVQSYTQLQQRFGDQMRIINSYGVTEAAIDSTWFDGKDMPGNYFGNTPIGKPFANTEVYILDDNNALVPPGVTGGLWIGGAGVAQGYWNEPGLTNERFIENPFRKEDRIYKTGDLARWLDNGVVEYCGRKDDQVKIRGYRIEPGEIKAALLRIEGVEDVVVTTTNGEEKELVAYWKGDTSENIRKRLAAVLPGYMVPAWIMHIDHIPLTPNGKVDKKALPVPGEMNGDEARVVKPRNACERQLASLWSEVLRLPEENIGIAQNFFELGGHSLKAVRLLTLMHQRFNVQFRLNELFTRVTIAAQSELIAASQKAQFAHISLAPLGNDYPLSSSQRRLWVLCQHEAANAAYSIQGALRLDGQLNTAALEAALTEVIIRHEILRTVFRLNVHGEVRQVITEDPGFSLAQYDLRKCNDPQAESDELLARLGGESFDLSNGPLVKAAVLRIADGAHLFFCNMHHIISDGWSIEVLIKEVFLCYNAQITGTDSGLKPLRIQYKDYANWQLQQLENGALQDDKNYWLEQFAGELPVLDLPEDYPRPRIHSYSGGAVYGALSPELFTAFDKMLKKHNATLFMGLLAVVNTLLHRYTHQNDFIIGTPVAGRGHADLEGQIGCYINTLALRTRLKDGETFFSLLDTVKELTRNAYDHQGCPFDALADELDLKRDLSRSMLFDVMIVLQNNENLSEGMVLKDIELSDYHTGLNSSKFDWLFNFIETGEGLRYVIEYNSDIYACERMQNVQRHFEQLVTAVLSAPDQLLTTLPYLQEREKNELLNVFNDTEADYPKGATILDLFEEQVKQHPNEIAVVFNDVQLSFRELNQQANQLGDYLKKQYDIQPEDCVAVMLDRSVALIVTLLGILKAGGAYVPIDPEFPEERVDFILQDCGSKVLVDADEWKAFSTVQQEYSNRNKKSKLTPQSLMYVIYTSGSTGQPKGCMLEHRGVMNRIDWMWRHYGFKHTDIILQKTTYTFDVSVWELFMPLAWGCKMVLAQKEDIYDPGRILTLIAQQEITCLHFVPGMLNVFVSALEQENASADKLASLRSVITSGEALTPALVNRWFSICSIPVYNLYGPTEASIDVTHFDIYKDTDRVLIGKPIANTRMYILRNDQLVPAGVTGEICIAGDGLARGYLNRPELTDKAFTAHPFSPGERIYRTGDLGRWLPDGSIEFIGRKDHQVKIRGYRIELQEVELALLLQDPIDEVAVVDIVAGSGEKELAAYIVSRAILNITDIRSALAKILPQYMLPTYFVQLEHMPLTSNGKLDRKALPVPQEIIISSESGYIPPVTETQHMLVDIWSAVLERKPDQIGIKDNFFEIG